MFSKTTNIDIRLQDLLLEEIKKIRADYAEIRAEEKFSTRIVYEGIKPEFISEPQSLGFFVRVLINGSWGVTTFTDISLLKEKITQAINFAKFQGKGNIILSKVSTAKDQIFKNQKKDFNKVPLKEKVTLMKHYSILLLKSVPNIQTTVISYSDAFITKFFINSTGARIFEQRPYVRLHFQAVGKNNDIIEPYLDSRGHIGGYEIVENLDKEMIKVSKGAAELAKAPKVKSGNYTVILDPYMAGTFAHEAYGHFSEADHQYENPNILKQMKLGRKIGSNKVTIIDDPNLTSGWGNFVYDEEGIKGEKVNLITNGVISGRLHSLETAGKLKEFPNGHARADGFRSKPIVRMSNTFFKPGKENLKDLISSTSRGILVIKWIAGMTAMENFTFTGLYGVMIEKGKLTKKVRGVKLLGNVFYTLQKIDGVTNDFAQDQGTCGKVGQSVPVGSGGGYVRIQNITVGGS